MHWRLDEHGFGHSAKLAKDIIQSVAVREDPSPGTLCQIEISMSPDRPEALRATLLSANATQLLSFLEFNLSEGAVVCVPAEFHAREKIHSSFNLGSLEDSTWQALL